MILTVRFTVADVDSPVGFV